MQKINTTINLLDHPFIGDVFVDSQQKKTLFFNWSAEQIAHNQTLIQQKKKQIQQQIATHSLQPILQQLIDLFTKIKKYSSLKTLSSTEKESLTKLIFSLC